MINNLLIILLYELHNYCNLIDYQIYKLNNIL